MLLSTKHLSGYKIDAIDGSIGDLYDLLIDDQTWIIRYIVVDIGSWLEGRKVLIAPSAVGTPDEDNKRMPIHLSRDQIENSPPIDTDLPVSRRQEIKLYGHYQWTPYWGGGVMPVGPAFAPTPSGLTAAAKKSSQNKAAEDADPHLRSTKEIINYRIHASDGEIGHVEDFIIDSDDWITSYLVVDTRNWLPGRKVVLSPRLIKGVSWTDSAVTVSMSKAAIENSPEHDPSLLNREIAQ